MLFCSYFRFLSCVFYKIVNTSSIYIFNLYQYNLSNISNSTQQTTLVQSSATIHCSESVIKQQIKVLYSLNFHLPFSHFGAFLCHSLCPRHLIFLFVLRGFARLIEQPGSHLYLAVLFVQKYKPFTISLYYICVCNKNVFDGCILVHLYVQQVQQLLN